jgi:hypothetical protein
MARVRHHDSHTPIREHHMSQLQNTLTIRPASAADALALSRLAALDSAEVPAAPVLVAEVGGRLRAAVSLWDGRSIADPFHPTADVLALMRAHIARARGRTGLGAKVADAVSAGRRGRPAPATARWHAA